MKKNTKMALILSAAVCFVFAFTLLGCNDNSADATSEVASVDELLTDETMSFDVDGESLNVSSEELSSILENGEGTVTGANGETYTVAIETNDAGEKVAVVKNSSGEVKATTTSVPETKAASNTKSANAETKSTSTEAAQTTTAAKSTTATPTKATQATTTAAPETTTEYWIEYGEWQFIDDYDIYHSDTGILVCYEDYGRTVRSSNGDWYEDKTYAESCFWGYDTTGLPDGCSIY